MAKSRSAIAPKLKNPNIQIKHPNHLAGLCKYPILTNSRAFASGRLRLGFALRIATRDLRFGLLLFF